MDNAIHGLRPTLLSFLFVIVSFSIVSGCLEPETSSVRHLDDDGQPPITDDDVSPLHDNDSDSYGSQESGGDDCDDYDGTIHPDAYEGCDLIDNDCDGSIEHDSSAIVGPLLRVHEWFPTTPLGPPILLWGENSYQVFWVERESSPIESLRIFMAEMTASGQETAEPNFIAETTGDIAFSVAWNGADFGMVWNSKEMDGSEVVAFQRIDSWSQPVGERQILFPADGGYSNHELLWTGESYGLISHGREGIQYRQLSSTGETTRSQSLPVAGGDGSLDVAWTGTEFGLAWIGLERVLFARMNEWGELVDDPHVVGEAHWLTEVELAWSGSRYGVVWNPFDELGIDDIFFTAFDSDGGLAVEPIRITNHEYFGVNGMSILWSGTSFGLAWGYIAEEDLDATGNYFVELDENGASLSDLLTINSGSWGWRPSLAFSGREFAAVGRDSGIEFVRFGECR